MVFFYISLVKQLMLFSDKFSKRAQTNCLGCSAKGVGWHTRDQKTAVHSIKIVFEIYSWTKWQGGCVDTGSVTLTDSTSGNLAK